MDELSKAAEHTRSIEQFKQNKYVTLAEFYKKKYDIFIC